MRRLSVILLGVAALTVAVVLILSKVSPLSTTEPNWAVLPAAVQAYTRDLRAKGTVLPATVTLQQLIEAGYISPEIASGFDGIVLTFSLQPAAPGAPSYLVRAQLPNGEEHAVMADGSVQQLPTKSQTSQR